MMLSLYKIVVKLIVVLADNEILLLLLYKNIMSESSEYSQNPLGYPLWGIQTVVL